MKTLRLSIALKYRKTLINMIIGIVIYLPLAL